MYLFYNTIVYYYGNEYNIVTQNLTGTIPEILYNNSQSTTHIIKSICALNGPRCQRSFTFKNKNKLSSRSGTKKYKMSKAMREIINEFMEIRS